MKKLLLLLLVLLVASSSAMAAGKLAIGTWRGTTTAKYDFTSDLSGTLGASYIAPPAGAASMLGLLIKLDYNNLPKMGEVKTGLGVYYTTNGAAAATTAIGITYNASAMIKDNLSVGADFILANQTTVGGASTTGIIPAVAVTAYLYL